MKPSILTDWTPQKAAAFTRETLPFRHRLHERLMFTDAGLIDILDRYPRERLAVYAMGDDPTDASSWRRGVAGDLTGAELLRAVGAGRLCLTLRALDRHSGAYAALAEEIFADKARFAPHVRTSGRELTLTISSPGAQTFYQADLAATSMFQLRGRRSLWVYPAEAPYVTEDHLERRTLGQAGRMLAYDPVFDQAARHMILQPGAMAAWPQAAPFRAVNYDLNVTLTAEFMTPAARMRADIIYANACLRRSFGASPVVQAGLHPKALGKAALGQVLQRIDRKRTFARARPQFRLALSRTAA